MSEIDRLSDVAQVDKRLVGHIYKRQFLASKGDVPFSSVDRLKVARAQRFVFASERTVDAPRHFEESRNELIFESAEELDYARAVLNVATPSSVSCVGMQRCDQPEILRATARFAFTTPGDSKLIEIESRALGRASALGENRKIPTYGSIVFGGDGCGFALNSQGDFSDQIWKVTWNNFLECVRSRRSADLMAPISEYASTLKLLSWADRSLKSGETIFDDGAQS
jgi:hypothetical protein